MRKPNKFFIFFVFILLIWGCDKIGSLAPGQFKKQADSSPPPGAVVVAKVGNFYVTSDDLNREIEAYNNILTVQGLEENKIDTREEKINYLRNEVIPKFVLYQEALDKRLDRRPDIARDVENIKRDIVVSELLREETENIDVSSQEIEDFYTQNKELLREPQQRKILEIMSPTEEEAKQIYIELLQGGDFSTLARRYSKAATASSGGDIGYMSLEFDPEKRIRFEEFYETAFSPSLKKGNISAIFKGPDGYYIIKVEDIKTTEPKSLAELWDSIKSLLLLDKRQRIISELSNRLSGQTKIEIYEGRVE